MEFKRTPIIDTKSQVYTVDIGNGETAEVEGYFDDETANIMNDLLNEYRLSVGRNLSTINDTTSLEEVAKMRAVEVAYKATTQSDFGHSQDADWWHTRPNGVYATRHELITLENAVSNRIVNFSETVDDLAHHFIDDLKSSYIHDETMLVTNITKVGTAVFYLKVSIGDNLYEYRAFAVQDFS
jgi:hypothetical protein